MIVGVPREIASGECRVALVPDAVKALLGAGVDVVVESGAGVAAGFPDADFEAAGARISSDAGEVLGSDLVLKVRAPQETGDGSHEVDRLREGGSLICFLNPLDQPQLAERLAKRRVDSFSMELMPRVTRARISSRQSPTCRRPHGAA